jgi:hypothetical protein
LESNFLEITFWKTNTAKKKQIILETKPNFSLTGKLHCFQSQTDDATWIWYGIMVKKYFFKWIKIFNLYFLKFIYNTICIQKYKKLI